MLSDFFRKSGDGSAMIGGTRPRIALTMGDVAGIGPEVILKALQHADFYERARPLVIGDRQTLKRAAAWGDATHLTYDSIADPANGH